MRMRMKTKLGIAASLLLAGTIHAAVVDYNWSGGFVNGTVVPDNNTNGWADSRKLSGLNGTVSGLAVTLDLTGGWNGDLYAYVQYGSGFTALLNRVGVSEAHPSGNAGEGVQVTFSADGTPGLHTYLGNGTGLLTGVWQPDGAGFNSFLGLNPNGDWRLFVADLGGGDLMTVNSWGLHLELSAVPEPSEWAAMSFGLLGLAWVAKRLSERRLKAEG